MRRKNKRELRVYQQGDPSIWHVDEKGRGYPKVKCAYKDADCTTDCAHFNVTRWSDGGKVFCGNIQMGVLA
jgi:hypothetical protein